jgi:hypothetical protein
MPTPKRNWRLEIAAWLAAIALVTAALIFSSGSDEPDVQQPKPEPLPEVTVPVRP